MRYIAIKSLDVQKNKTNTVGNIYTKCYNKCMRIVTTKELSSYKILPFDLYNEANGKVLGAGEVLTPGKLIMLKNYAKLFTDLKNGEQITALEFHPSGLVKALSGGAALPLGYLDMDKVDDFILALEKMLEEHNNAGKKDKFTVSYTAPGGIDAYYTTDFPGQPAPIVLFRKKWFTTNEYGVQTSIYSSAVAILPIKSLTNFISSLKEAQTIANQSLGK